MFEDRVFSDSNNKEWEYCSVEEAHSDFEGGLIKGIIRTY